MNLRPLALLRILAVLAVLAVAPRLVQAVLLRLTGTVVRDVRRQDRPASQR
ncbi:hypothetical protein [Nocardioides humi]|uniref:Uncharacterized protein n=1 Tax=Nocardioides humi TaxID=449461 RepID=A0ABN2BG87_9ACTN|nr:hypothetical protein [Nocardioides humi]